VGVDVDAGSIRVDMKAIWIRADRQVVELVEFGGYEDLYRMAGGYLEVARAWHDTGDVLYVDAAGVAKLKMGSPFFTIAGGQKPFASNGVIVGREPVEEVSDDLANYDPVITVDEVRKLVSFRRYLELVLR
jgi:hypothetical protein